MPEHGVEAEQRFLRNFRHDSRVHLATDDPLQDWVQAEPVGILQGLTETCVTIAFGGSTELIK